MENAQANGAALPETCAICLCELDARGAHRALQLHCGHVYGAECIEQWLTLERGKHAHCPRCNKPAGRREHRRELCPVSGGLQARDGEQDAALRSKLNTTREKRQRAERHLEHVQRRREEVQRRIEEQRAALGAGAPQESSTSDAVPSVAAAAAGTSASAAPAPPQLRRLAHKLPHAGGRVLCFDSGGSAVLLSHAADQWNASHGYTRLSLRDLAARPRVPVHTAEVTRRRVAAA